MVSEKTARRGSFLLRGPVRHSRGRRDRHRRAARAFSPVGKRAGSARGDGARMLGVGMTDAAALLDTLASLDRNDALALNAFNLAAFLYLSPLDAPRSGRYLLAERDGVAVLLPHAPEMHRLPDLWQRLMVEALKRSEILPARSGRRPASRIPGSDARRAGYRRARELGWTAREPYASHQHLPLSIETQRRLTRADHDRVRLNRNRGRAAEMDATPKGCSPDLFAQDPDDQSGRGATAPRDPSEKVTLACRSTQPGGTLVRGGRDDAQAL